MTGWVLVLILFGATGGPAMTTIPMSSEALCVNAGEQYLKQLNKGVKSPHYVCVRTGS